MEEPKATKRVLKYDTWSNPISSRAQEVATPKLKEVRNAKAENVTCLKVLPGTRICLEATVRKPTSNANLINQSLTSVTHQASELLTTQSPLTSETSGERLTSHSVDTNSTSTSAVHRDTTKTAFDTIKTNIISSTTTTTTTTTTTKTFTTTTARTTSKKHHHVYYEEEIPLATAMMPTKTTRRSPRRRVTPSRAEKRRERMRKEKGKQVKDGKPHKLPPHSWEENMKVQNKEKVIEATSKRGRKSKSSRFQPCRHRTIVDFMYVPLLQESIFNQHTTVC